MTRKGILFSMDGFIAATLLIGTLLLIANTAINEAPAKQISYVGKDVLSAFSIITMLDLNASNNSFVVTNIEDGNITHLNNSVLVQIGEFWALNQTELAQQLAESVLGGIIPGRLGFNLSIGNETIFLQNSNGTNDLVSSRRMISGVEKGQAISGSSSVAFLKKIKNKVTSAYSYFGGFAGQGNLSLFMEEFPNEFVPEDVTDIVVEVAAGEEFALYINGDHCADFSPSGDPMEPDYWSVPECNTSLSPGINNLSINFDGLMNRSYIAGGYIRVDYRTNRLISNATYGTKRYYFPGVNGVINLYDSFYVPGQLNGMTAHLKFFSDNPTYLTIGDKVVFMSDGNDTDIQEYYLSNAYFQNVSQPPLPLDYNRISNGTVPIRLASFNVTSETVTSGNADVIIITDFSGSMKKAVSSWEQGTGISDCAVLYTYDDARKTHLARCLDNELVEIVMNYSGNRVWPVFYHDDVVKWYNNPEAKDAIEGYISSFGPQGKEKTCISCAINRAYDILDAYSNDSRSKFIVLMSDGLPTHCPDGSCTSASSIYGNEICQGFCDENGQSGCDNGNATNFPGCLLSETDCVNAEDSTYYAAQRAVDDLNASIFTVGFGLVGSCDRASILLQDIADMNGGTYQHSDNVSELRLIYENISNEILTRIEQYSQTVNVPTNLSPSLLYNDSWIELQYTPFVDDYRPGEIELKFQTDQFGTCSPSIFFYPQLRVVDSKMVSYSGIHWTDQLVLHNWTNDSIYYNDSVIYNLSEFYLPYPKLGDPYQVQVPANLLLPGWNNFSIGTGDEPTNRTGCSYNNSMIYTALLNASTARTGVLPRTEGCNWTIMSEDGSEENIAIPADYAGTKMCYYTNTSMDYDQNDTYDAAVFGLLEQLDFDGNGKIVVSLGETDLEVIILLITGVPYQWGPAVLEAKTWQ